MHVAALILSKKGFEGMTKGHHYYDATFFAQGHFSSSSEDHNKGCLCPSEILQVVSSRIDRVATAAAIVRKYTKK